MNYQAFTNDSLTMMYEGDGCDLRRLTGRANQSLICRPSITFR